VLARLASVRTNTADPTESLGALMHREAERIERDLEAQARGERVGGMPTGLDRLDALTGGVPLGVTTVVLGETGHGKSTLGMSFARASADLAHDEPLVLSYEDGRRSYAQRGLAQESGVPTQVIRRRSFRPGEERRVLVEGLRRAGLRRERIARVRGMGVDELCTLVRRTRAKGPRSPGARTAANLVVVDYLQAMPRPQGRAIRAEHEALGEIARRLEDLAATEECAVVVFSQVNDECAHREDHRPRLRDVAGGRDLVKGAKLVLGLYRPWLYDAGADPHAGEILVLKNNDGETRRAAHVHLDLATHTIRDAAPASMPPATQLALGGEPP
jgi:replicative DNA helicase